MTLVKDNVAFPPIIYPQPVSSFSPSHFTLTSFFLSFTYMDPNSFSSNPNPIPQETPSMVIPEDPFISPLYEAMFPFGATAPSISTTITPYDLSFDPNYCSTIAPPMFSIGESHDSSYPQLFPTTDYADILPSAAYIDTLQPAGYFMSLLNSDLPTYPESSFSLRNCPSQLYQQQSSEEVAPQAFNNNIKVTGPNNINDKTGSYTYSKYKYVCEPCRVYFSTPQALGGHMSYHSKERKGMPIAPIRRSVCNSGKTENTAVVQAKQCNEDKGKDILINIDNNNDDDVSSAAGEIDLDIIPWGDQVEFNNLLEEGMEEAAPDHEDLQLIMTDVDVSAMINEMFVDFDCIFDN